MRLFATATSFEFSINPQLVALLVVAYLCTLFFLTLVLMIAPDLLEGWNEK